MSEAMHNIKRHLQISTKLTLVDGDICIAQHNQTNSLQQQQQHSTVVH